MENVAEAYDSLLFKIDDIQRKLNEVIKAHNEMTEIVNGLKPKDYTNRYNKYT